MPHIPPLPPQVGWGISGSIYDPMAGTNALMPAPQKEKKIRDGLASYLGLGHCRALTPNEIKWVRKNCLGTHSISLPICGVPTAKKNKKQY